MSVKGVLLSHLYDFDNGFSCSLSVLCGKADFSVLTGPDDCQCLAVIGIAAAAKITQFVEGTGRSEPDQRSAFRFHIDQSPLGWLDSAVFVCILQAYKCKMPG